ncbi:MAG TPA: hypothetical protein PKN75_14595 [Bacteroidia bacterium]|nr:hypothetical protein [Bacteroidia bacterium]HNU34814.1 hypothetical protein [Bacteroidia bacterium]
MKKRDFTLNIFSYFLVFLIIAYFIFRLCFYLVLGDPLEMGNIPLSAPSIFVNVKKVLMYLFGSSLVVLAIYFVVIYKTIKEKKMDNKGYVLLLFIVLSYSLFWFFDFGSLWLFW